MVGPADPVFASFLRQFVELARPVPRQDQDAEDFLYAPEGCAGEPPVQGLGHLSQRLVGHLKVGRALQPAAQELHDAVGGLAERFDVGVVYGGATSFSR